MDHFHDKKNNLHALLWNWRGGQRGREDQVEPKHNGGELVRKRGMQAGGNGARALAANRSGWKWNVYKMYIMA